MKRIILKAIMVSATVLLATSCSKQGASWFSGNYTFKTSGTITVCAEGGDNESEITLTTESGQMDIITIDKGNGRMLVTMNIISGPVVVFDAIVDGKELELEPATRQITVSVTGITSESLRPSAQVDVSGYANRYGDTVIFYLMYEGSYSSLGITYDIVSSDVKCVAKLN